MSPTAVGLQQTGFRTLWKVDWPTSPSILSIGAPTISFSPWLKMLLASLIFPDVIIESHFGVIVLIRVFPGSLVESVYGHDISLSSFF